MHALTNYDSGCQRALLQAKTFDKSHGGFGGMIVVNNKISRFGSGSIFGFFIGLPFSFFEFFVEIK